MYTLLGLWSSDNVNSDLYTLSYTRFISKKIHFSLLNLFVGLVELVVIFLLSKTNWCTGLIGFFLIIDASASLLNVFQRTGIAYYESLYGPAGISPLPEVQTRIIQKSVIEKAWDFLFLVSILCYIVFLLWK